MITIKKSSIFPAAKEEVYNKLLKLETLQYIAYPYATFKPINGETELIWKENSSSTFSFRLFGIIPFGIHTIKVIRFGLENGILTNETNTYVPVWNHEIILEKLNENTTKYTDIVEIEAGWKTMFVYLWAKCFYGHRQRKWRKILIK